MLEESYFVSLRYRFIRGQSMNASSSVKVTNSYFPSHLSFKNLYPKNVLMGRLS